MIKVLFITHDVSIYGASRSLQTLLNNYDNENVQVDLAVNKKIVGKQDKADIGRRFNVPEESIVEFYLPFSLCWSGQPALPFQVKIKNMLSRLTRSALNNFIKKENYDAVYLNSLVLHTLVTKEVKFITHVREVFDRTHHDVIRNLKKAKGIIYIDQSTHDAFAGELVEHSIILNNPFDMRRVQQASSPDVPAERTARTVFSIIGQVQEGKGTLFIIQSFIQSTENTNGTLLIVGGGDEDYTRRCKQEAAGRSNIIFYGEESSIEKIYKISDYIIRGESFPCIGRTVYEGLYSGCDVIIPGSKADNTLGIESFFLDSVHFYEPRNIVALAKIFDRCMGNKITKRTYTSNVNEYVGKFHSFLMACLTTQ